MQIKVDRTKMSVSDHYLMGKVSDVESINISERDKELEVV